MGNNENVHADHRSRLKQRFISEGIDGFQPHNILELLLFFSIPRRDTNETAHLLLNKFKTLSGVFDADFNSLCEVDGIGENSALLIKLIPCLWKLYSVEKSLETGSVTSVTEAGEFLVNLYRGETREVVYILLMTSAGRMFDYVKLNEGDVSSGYVSPRKLAETVLSRGAASFILAHNHPDGKPDPSSRDSALTRQFNDIFRLMEMPMLAHIIVAGEAFRIIPL